MRSKYDAVDQLEEEQEQSQPLSKTQRKKRVEALQDIGTHLVELEPAVLAKMDLPDNLREAVQNARNLKAHGARRRQLQYIGKLMRNADAEHIQHQLDALQEGSHARRRYDRLIEEWRERLINESDGLAALIAEYPQIEFDEWLSLLEQARQEIKQVASTPKAYRKIYQMLKIVIPFSY